MISVCNAAGICGFHTEDAVINLAQRGPARNAISIDSTLMLRACNPLASNSVRIVRDEVIPCTTLLNLSDVEL